MAQFGEDFTLFTSTGMLCVIFLSWYAYWHIRRRHMLELAERIPGPKGLPLIGSMLEFTGNPHDLFLKALNRSMDYDSDVLKVWLGPMLGVVVFHPQDIEMLLSSQEHIKKSDEYKMFKPWFGNGLLISSGQKWRTHRKLIAPTFHMNVLKNFIQLFNSNSKECVNRLRSLKGSTFDCHEAMLEVTVEILLETVMGVSKETPAQSGYEYAKAVLDMTQLIHMRQTRIWLRPDILFNLSSYKTKQSKLLSTIHGFTSKVFKSKKEAFLKGLREPSASKRRRKGKSEVEDGRSRSFDQFAYIPDDLDEDENDIGAKKRLAFLDLLIESSYNDVVINDDEIKQQVDTIMFEGHDTIAAAASFFLSLMGIYQDIQLKVHQELDEIFDHSDRPATFNDTLEMKYLERCLLETLRLYPPVPVIGRKLKKDLTIATGGHVLPAGCTVGIAIFKLHRRPDIYPNPNKFDPDNFLPERAAARHYYAFIPFSAGLRSCVGRKYAMLNLKILLSTVLRTFRVHTDLTENDFQLQADIILKRAEGFPIRLESRKASK